MRDLFLKGLSENQSVFGMDLSETAERLADYYEFLLAHNKLLHLVAPCPSGEFAVRHVLESLTLLEYLPTGAAFVDVGAGGGLPSIPCLLVRNDLSAVLIESKEKKASFLRDALEHLGIGDRTSVIGRQFEEADAGRCDYVTCRAIDKFTQKLPRLLKWTGKRGWLFFGGDSLRQALDANGQIFTEQLMPLSERRFLFVRKS